MMKSENKLDKYEKLQRVEDGTYKINLIKTLLSGCGYQPGYVGRSMEFLNSVEKQFDVFNGGMHQLNKERATESNVQTIQVLDVNLVEYIMFVSR